MQDNTESRLTLWHKIEHVRVGMLTTVGADKSLRSRPMTSQKVDKDGVLWFFTSDQAAVAEQIETNAAVNVCFTAHEESLYVSVAGTAQIVHDRVTIEGMWNPMVGAWFPGGPSDPHVALIRVAVGSAEYWDSDKSKMMQLLAMAKAAVTGKPPVDIGTHKKFDL